MNHERWIGDSCTGSNLGHHHYHGPCATKRARYLTTVANGRHHVWPFVHALVGMAGPFHRPWFTQGDLGLDPLVIPLLDLLNARGVNTISSCQGNDWYSPHILFAGPFKQARAAQQVVAQFDDSEHPFDQPIVALESMRKSQGGQGWSIYFHDTIALIAFNVKLGVSIESQLAPPAWFKGEVAKAADIANLI